MTDNLKQFIKDLGNDETGWWNKSNFIVLTGCRQNLNTIWEHNCARAPGRKANGYKGQKRRPDRAQDCSATRYVVNGCLLKPAFRHYRATDRLH